MRTVDIGELGQNLDSYLQIVRAGEVVLVTERGELIAELGPPRRARASSAEIYAVPASCAPEGTAQRLLDEERGDH